MRRLWISSMEEAAIEIAHLKNSEIDAVFASAVCRAKADWLMVSTATRLFLSFTTIL